MHVQYILGLLIGIFWNFQVVESENVEPADMGSWLHFFWGMRTFKIHSLSNLLVYNTVIIIQSLCHVRLFATPWTEDAGLPCPSPSPRGCSNSCPLSQWCYLTISSFAIHFSFYLQSFRASGSIAVSRPFPSDGQSIGASDSASVFPVNIHSRFPLGLTGLISFQPKGLSRESSPAPQFKSINSLALSLCYSPTLTFCTWLLEKT